MCRRILRAFVGRGLLESFDVKEILAYQHSELGSAKRGVRADELHLKPLELIECIVALVTPPHTHRHRYFGVLAPNSPLRAAVTALAAPVQAMPVATGLGGKGPQHLKTMRGHPCPNLRSLALCVRQAKN